MQSESHFGTVPRANLRLLTQDKSRSLEHNKSAISVRLRWRRSMRQPFLAPGRDGRLRHGRFRERQFRHHRVAGQFRALLMAGKLVVLHGSRSGQFRGGVGGQTSGGQLGLVLVWRVGTGSGTAGLHGAHLLRLGELLLLALLAVQEEEGGAGEDADKGQNAEDAACDGAALGLLARCRGGRFCGRGGGRCAGGFRSCKQGLDGWVCEAVRGRFQRRPATRTASDLVDNVLRDLVGGRVGVVHAAPRLGRQVYDGHAFHLPIAALGDVAVEIAADGEHLPVADEVAGVTPTRTGALVDLDPGEGGETEGVDVIVQGAGGGVSAAVDVDVIAGVVLSGDLERAEVGSALWWCSGCLLLVPCSVAIVIYGSNVEDVDGIKWNLVSWSVLSPFIKSLEYSQVYRSVEWEFQSS